MIRKTFGVGMLMVVICFSLLCNAQEVKRENVVPGISEQGERLNTTLSFDAKTNILKMVIKVENPRNPIDAFGFRVLVPDYFTYEKTEFGELVNDWHLIGANLKGNTVIVGGLDPVKSISAGKSGVLAILYFKGVDATRLADYARGTVCYKLVDDIRDFHVVTHVVK